ncbi:hypothetical protein ASPZODRAFT_1371467 [Penicilliopsis zonata CBS 506.65]|uniref:Transcription factor IIIC subunit 5 HTH domain-containing protein n=1 Tax=Penicilliopsis zonata CBS 506.65 TaxID=1073090 RepID=A0A1L9SP82_9EURO|nr:hypothetical protein ASPZODRAFT_1371467 [Penicilliopsis zonata CBS 506.65]OJJ49000.1 hypothetical protein ASPZODRAFT_1371467 [Penicilliopsis zonata CBS 506.65]
MAQRGLPRTAPFYEVPPLRVVSVEHPGVVRNVDNAIRTLQGSDGIGKILNPPKADTPANLVLRPEDAMARPLQSTSSQSNNILLKVTVPRRTGRKRKRGSDEPFIDGDVDTAADDGSLPRRSARQLLQSLRDNEYRYQVEPVGKVERTHVFRGMPDFVFSTASSTFANRFREQILSYDYQKMKQFDINMTKGETMNVEIFPPPSFSHGDVPFSYMYRQNPTVKLSVDDAGKVTTFNTQQATKVLTHLVPYDIESVPSAPRDSCPPLDTLDPALQETIASVRALFAERVAWTRRGLRNSLTTLEQRYQLRHAIPYVAYIFRSGPWRDAIIKFGHDPRTAPCYRFYQTVMFRILPRDPELARDSAGGRRHTLPRPSAESNILAGSSGGGGGGSAVDPTMPGGGTAQGTSHLFTGQRPFPRDGKMWMLCDITDPLLAQSLFPEGRPQQATLAAALASTPPDDFLRPTCDIVSDGWFGDGTLGKLKTIMRDKILTLIRDATPSDSDYARILAFPDHTGGDENLGEFMLDGGVASVRDLQLATEVRATIRGAPNWRTDAVKRNTGQTGPPPGKRVQWGDVSEGEEEAVEREEAADAVVERNEMDTEHDD